MLQLTKDIFSIIRHAYPDMTNVEKSIADCFLNDGDLGDLSLEAVSSRLFVSKASLSRFAKTCGFDGYREFVYQFRRDIETHQAHKRLSATTQGVLGDYQNLFSSTVALIDEAQIQRVVRMIQESTKLFIYGDGLSGYAASELMMRFKRLGFSVEAFTDDFMIRINSSIVQPTALVIGITVSGCTHNVLLGLRNVHKNGGRTIIITGNPDRKRFTSADEVLQVGTMQHLNTGMSISPQFPVLVMIDLLFNFYMQTDYQRNASTYQETLKALNYNWEGDPDRGAPPAPGRPDRQQEKS